MAGKTEPLPGTSDLWQPELAEWRLLEDSARDIFERYAFSEVRTPIFERTTIFTKSIGDDTDVVQKEMYTFKDRGNRSLTLRPEGTASVMRAIANKGLNQGEEKRVYYMGPMFRGERPAAGRRRQFHQIGVEAVGRCAPMMDVECISMLVHFLEEVGISDAQVLLNTRGVGDDKKLVTEALFNYFEPLAEKMCEDCQRRLHTNVSRMLDCKNEDCKKYASDAPAIVDLVCEDSREYFQQVCAGLDNLGIKYKVDPKMVRGLDYYVHTIFEVVHSGLGAQDAVAGGGRYQIMLPGGKKPVEGVGFACGMERLLMIREALGLKCEPTVDADIYIVSLGEKALATLPKLAMELRKSGLRVLAEVEKKSMKSQMRAANRVGVPIVLIRGENEIDDGVVQCKNMETSEQVQVPVAELCSWIKDALKK